MRTEFSRCVEHVPMWNGNQELPKEEQLVFEITPTDVGVFNELLEVIGRTQKALTVEDLEEKAKMSKPFAQYLASVVPAHCKSVGATLWAKDGSEITLQEITTKAPLVGLASELLYTLINVSKPTELDVKN